MSDPQLEWDQAEVRNGKLRLPVSGTRPRGWSESFERTVRLLGGSHGERDGTDQQPQGAASESPDAA